MENNTIPEVPCDICGKPTIFAGTRRCDDCWEVERKLDRKLEQYALTEKGRTHMRSVLNAVADIETMDNMDEGEL